MDHVRYPIVELRQYTLRPGQRDALIDVFDRELVETQETEGMAVVGQFVDLDRPDRFVWVRGFADMPSRAEALRRFYGGPAWKAHSAVANATMLEVDDVLLLRPITAGSGFPVPTTERPPPGQPPATGADGGTVAPSSLILATLCFRDRPFDDAFADFFEREVRPELTAAGAAPLAWLQTEYAENTFPALSVRTGEHVFVWFARLGGPGDLADHEARLARSQLWRRLSAELAGSPQQLRLAPTARSLLR